MGRKDNSKAKEKKAERKAMEAKMNAGLANVKLANSQDDPLSQLPSFTKYNKNGLNLTLETIRSPEADQKTKEWAYKLLEDNMSPVYEETYGKNPEFPEERFNGKEKKEELLHDNAWLLIARTEEGTPVAFAHFRYDMDYDDEVLYCYELQLEKKYRRKGLGRFIMKLLELLMIKADMLKIMATIFKKDKSNHGLFKECLKYEMDETSPYDDVEYQFEYEIVSRFNLKKKREMEDVENKPINN